MNKIKYLIGSFLAAIAFVLLGVNLKVNAATVENTFVFDSATELPAASKNGGVGNGSSADEVTGDTMALKITNNFSTSNISAYSSSKYISIRSTSATEYISFQFTTRGSGSFTLKSFTTQSDSKYATLTLYSVDADDALTSVSTKRVAVKGVDQEFSINAAGKYDFRIYGDSSQGSNISCASIVITETYENSSITNESLAVTSINNIGTVAYTMTSYEKIQAAKDAVDACTDPSAETISNYETYTSAVSTFEGLRTSNKTTFTTSVANIGTVTSDSKSLIDAAYAAYAKLLSIDAEAVSTEKTNLDALKKSYVLTYGDKVNEVVIDEVDDSLKGVNYSENTMLYTSNARTIFSGSNTSTIEKNTSSKTYNKVSYFHRFKTNGTIQVKDGNVLCALVVDAPSAGVIDLVAISGNSSSTRNLKIAKFVDGKLEVLNDLGNVVGGANAGLYSFTVTEAGTYYIGSDTVLEEGKVAGGVNVYKASFTAKVITSPVLEQQETSDGSSIRYIATLTNVLDLSQVESWTVTLSLTGKKDYTADFTTVYTSVAGTNGKSAVENTYYLVATIHNIPASYNGSEITCKISVKLAGEKTPLESNTKTFTVNVTGE